MTTPKRKPKPKPKPKSFPRYRNAVAPVQKERQILLPPPTNGSVPGEPESPGWHIAHTALGAAVATAIGIGGTRLGGNPIAITAGAALVGGYAAYTRDTPRSRSFMTGLASMAGMQFGLEMLKPTIGGGKANPAPTVIVATAATPPSTAAHKNADLGVLPPGALDAAFERARAQLAVSGDMHSHGEHVEHDRGHEVHHQTVPFIP